MIGRPHPRRRALANAVVSVLFAGATSAVLLAGASPAAARSVPAPSPSVTTAPGLSVHLDLGLLNVHVDLPPLTNLLGGAPTTTPVSRQPAAVVPAPTVAPSTAAPRTSAPVSRPVVPRPTSAPTPTKAATRPTQTGGGAGVNSGRDVANVVRKAPQRATRSATPRRTITKRRIAEANDTFQRALHPGAPAWLLLTVVGLCALGTAGFVRLAGRNGRRGV